MRDKFSELVEKGVAAFNYVNIASETPEYYEICRLYNNVWGVASDTHMGIAADGNTYITGKLVAQEHKWNDFAIMGNYGRSMGYWSLDDMLYRAGKCLNRVILNGDIVLRLDPFPSSAMAPVCPDCCVSCETCIKKPLSSITVDRKDESVKECFRGSIDEVVENLNSSTEVKGTNWIAANGNIYGIVDGKIIML